MKTDAGLANEVNTTMDNSQMIQNTGFNNQGIMAVNSVNDNSSGLQISHCVVGPSQNGGLTYETAAGRPPNTIPPAAEVW